MVLIVIGYLGNNLILDKMRIPLLKIGDTEFDIWSLSHVLLYVYFGYYFPEFFVEFLIIGTMWEIFESTFCSKQFMQVFNCSTIDKSKSSSNIVCQMINKVDNCGYWYGKLEDIPLNMLGFVIGAYIFHKYN